MSPGGNPPMSHRVYALNSFVLPTHEVDVSHAPIQGLLPSWINSTRLSGSFFQGATYDGSSILT
jgi:hypothetical protein